MIGLHVVKIDICYDNDMLFSKEDHELLVYWFCGKDRYYQKHGKGKKLLKQRMFYTPIMETLKHQLEVTASQMRWHTKYVSHEG